MVDGDQPIAENGNDEDKPPHLLVACRAQLPTALLSVLLLTLLTGAVFPLLLAALAHLLFPHQSAGSLLYRDGIVVGSELLGQNFTQPGYFHPRPSAAGYDPRASGGSNWAPGNRRLREAVRQRVEDYRHEEDLPPDTPIPLDAVTSSGSGLDPHISPANAALQVRRVARERHLSQEEVQKLVDEHTLGRQLGVLGEPRVAVLPLNLDLDRVAPLTR